MPVSRLSLSIATTLLVAGCSATGPTFKAEDVPPGEAIVYVYRESGLGLGARSAYFYVNDINVFDLDRFGYSWVTLPPGHYKLRQSWPIDIMSKPTQIEIDLAQGETRYFSFGTEGCDGPSGGICIRYTLQEVPRGFGRASIADKRFQDNFGAGKLRQSLEKK